MAATVDKVDFKRQFKEYYSPKPDHPEILKVPDFLFVMVDGAGDPDNSPEFAAAIEALYTVCYTLKFTRKKAGQGPDFTMGPLEGLWWSEKGERFEMGERKDWRWTLMIMMPILICPDEFTAAVAVARAKKPDNAKLKQIRLEDFDEGTVVQIMHVGPYADESRSTGLMQDLARHEGYAQVGRHHEIYLSNPGRVAPEKMKTIIRVAVEKPET